MNATPRRRVLLRTAVVLVLVGLAVAAGIARSASGSRVVLIEGGGDSRRGPRAIAAFGCGACHEIPGVAGADSPVAPPLTHFGDRAYIAGRLENTPENLIRWIMDPRSVDPETAMPDVGVPEEDARDIAAYLESLGRRSGGG